MQLSEATTLSPDEEGHSSLPLKRCEMQDEYMKSAESRRSRYTRVETNSEKSQPNKVYGEKKDNPVGVAKEGRRLGTQINKEDAVFATGLIIGSADTVEALQRKKELYRQELQEQIAEQYKNKKREKDLELKVAATGANDPEKQPYRIRQFGLSRRKKHQVLELLAPAEMDSSSSSRAVHNNRNIGVEDQEMPPPEHPHVAFPSPLLAYSSALGLAGGSGLSPKSYAAVPTFHLSMETPRLPLSPHPSSSVNEGFKGSNSDSHHFFGARNLIDPNISYYGQLPFPAGHPTSYRNVPPGVTSHLDYPRQNSGSSFPEPQIKPNCESATMDLHASVFPLERRSTRNRILSYRESLKQQIQEKQERKHLEREESERYEAQLEADMKNHQPWGRGGGGAPLRDSTGNLIVDLKQMHKLNEEAHSNPQQRQRRVAVMATRSEHSANTEGLSAVPEGSVHNSNDRTYSTGLTRVYTPQFARGNVFTNQPTQQQLQEQDKYKAYLKEQIEEKMHKKAEEMKRIRLEEEKEEKRLAEQRARIQKEYEEEQEKKKRKELEQKAKNEELIQLAEQKKKEAERRKKEEEEKESAALRRQYEREKQAQLEHVHREPSPPIPTLQKKHGLHHCIRPHTVDSHHSTVHMSERSLSGPQSPPVPACRNQLRAAGDQCDVVSELSALRRQLRSEQKRLEGHLQQDNWKVPDSPLSDRHSERPTVNAFDMARLRLQAPVRRPNFRNVEPRNLLRIHDSPQPKYSDEEAWQDFTDARKMEDVDVSRRKQWDYQDLHNRVSSQRSTILDDYFDMSPPPPPPHDLLRSVNVGYPRGSLLESESAFIDPLGDAFPVPHTSDLKKAPELSARERRRLTKQLQNPQPGCFRSELLTASILATMKVAPPTQIAD
ncbi:centrosome and spindle pole-associated protein 1-like isoform X2 [Betta splendens]|uniref:Centrosome and spindle pole-associated protein 1-like isoform X2 n=1 Tax=Betta splendens TaxID=158456 RepID=A0A9W2Y3Q1_BETSP|nr:centrosome and spindle pole-associated protein 1-like isoform X2 [Betta splendens]